MDGACINNGEGDAQAGCRIWYWENDPRNTGERVPHRKQSNQTGELTAVFLAVKRHDPAKDLRIISDSKYIIDGLTTNLKRWERRGWMDVSHSNLFRAIVAWAQRWTGNTYLQWVKGHSGIRGNEEADRLASTGAVKPMTLTDNNLAPLREGRKLGQLWQASAKKTSIR